MPEAAALLFELQVSRRARRVVLTARWVSGLAALACLAAVLLEPTLLRGIAALVSIAASMATFVDRPGPGVRQISIDRDGTVRIRFGDVDHPATVRYCSTGYLCLRTAKGSIAVWPDSLSAPNWRRLLVSCRWPHALPTPGTLLPVTARTK